mgnify:CR=1 FL=1
MAILVIPAHREAPGIEELRHVVVATHMLAQAVHDDDRAAHRIEPEREPARAFGEAVEDVYRRERAERKLEELATTDALTGLRNRRKFDQIIAQHWRQAQQRQQPLALLMIDADHFKTFNDMFGHQAGDDVLVVVSTGGRPVGTLPSLPPNARAAAFLPYDELLPRTAVYVTNGGYGGVQYALRHGVPIVATGGKEDKPEVGARVAWSGVGRRIRSEHPSPAALRTAILDVLNRPHYRQVSQRIAADLAAAPGFSGLAAVVDDLITAQAVGH